MRTVPCDIKLIEPYLDNYCILTLNLFWNKISWTYLSSLLRKTPILYFLFKPLLYIYVPVIESNYSNSITRFILIFDKRMSFSTLFLHNYTNFIFKLHVNFVYCSPLNKLTFERTLLFFSLKMSTYVSHFKVICPSLL